MFRTTASIYTPTSRGERGRLVRVLALRNCASSQPQRDVGRLYRLRYYSHQIVVQRLQVCLVALLRLWGNAAGPQPPTSSFSTAGHTKEHRKLCPPPRCPTCAACTCHVPPPRHPSSRTSSPTHFNPQRLAPSFQLSSYVVSLHCRTVLRHIQRVLEASSWQLSADVLRRSIARGRG